MWEYFTTIDWQAVLEPQMPLPEMVLRGLVIYFSLSLLFRVVLKRQAGKIGLGDLLVVAIIAGVARNALIADADSIPDGLGIIVVIILCNYAFNWLSYNSPLFHYLTHPAPTQLIDQGRILRDNLQTELMTEKQLMTQLRGQGIRSLEEVQEAWFEATGQISVLRKIEDESSVKKLETSPHCPERNGHPLESAPAHREPAPPSSGAEESVLDQFLESARKLADQIRRQEEQAAELTEQARKWRQVLADWSRQMKTRSPSAKPRRPSPGNRGAPEP